MHYYSWADMQYDVFRNQSLHNRSITTISFLKNTCMDEGSYDYFVSFSSLWLYLLVSICNSCTDFSCDCDIISGRFRGLGGL